eukprot:TRINITY_DN3094_c0_g1_i1.p1 TRINITY_DN3094_c0_g1~~TRINITY_DN3094_c0_g1_i1.p1  ORF type:complete len:383 (+),score=63.83 TRINITY_DN3094_c0_g1_i1:966-2114(+)
MSNSLHLESIKAVETGKEQEQQQEHQSYPSTDQLPPSEQAEKPREQQSGSPGDVPAPRATHEGGGGDATKLSWEDIQLVQNLIERCLQLYMSQDEVIQTLSTQARIKPGFTSLVWQKLEEQNADFFKAYYARLKLKNQIILFNHLLEQQYQFMNMQLPPKYPLAPIHSGHHFPIGYPVIAHPPVIATGHPSMVPVPGGPLSVPMGNGVSYQENFQSSHESPRTENLSSIPTELPSVVQSPSADISSINEMPLGSSPMMSSAPFPFNPADICGMGISLDGQFSSNENPCSSGMGNLHMPSEGEHACGKEISFYQLPRNFSLSDLTADLTHEDLGPLGSYSGSPFLSPETDVYFKSPDKDDIEEDKILESIIDPCYQSNEEDGG